MSTHEASPDTHTGLNRPVAMMWGVCAAVVAVAVGELFAALIAPRSAPLSAVGDLVIEVSPQPVVEWAKDTLGTSDKAVLQIGTVIVLAAAAAGLGLLARRHMWVGWAGLAAFTVFGGGAALRLPDATVVSVVPSLCGGLAAAVVLWWLRGVVEGVVDTGEDLASDPRRWGRRRFLVRAGWLSGGALVVGVASRQWAQGTAVNAARNEVVLPATSDPAPKLPADVEWDVEGLGPWRTPNADFYRIDTALTTPSINPEDYRLRIFGRVARELNLTYRQLLDYPMITRDITLCCVSNEVGGDLVGNARWMGVPLATLLDEVGPDADADQLVGRSSDGWTAGTPTELCRDGRDAMLAVAMNGEPLPLEHGFPVRMIVPGLYGYVSATKWLTELELTSFDAFDPYWIERGWGLPSPIKTQSRIDTPRGNAAAGTIAVAGVAWAQHRGIGAVEVQVDDGPWQEAKLSQVTSTDTWRQWVWKWEDAEPGEHTLTVRATDDDGQTQTSKQAPVLPDGATGRHSVSVTVE